MIDPNLLEKQLDSWIPRRPSAKIAERLFPRQEKVAPAMGLLRNSTLWGRLTPMAACFLTLLVIWTGGNHRQPVLQGFDNSSLYAAFMLDAPANSNSPRQTFALRKADANLEWNAPPALFVRSSSSGPADSHFLNWPRMATNGFVP